MYNRNEHNFVKQLYSNKDIKKYIKKIKSIYVHIVQKSKLLEQMELSSMVRVGAKRNTELFERFYPAQRLISILLMLTVISEMDFEFMRSNLQKENKLGITE